VSEPHRTADYGFDLGPYTRTITTTSADAQRWFDRGLNWTFGYNHEEAAACFEQALRCDPECAMALWGLAYVVGPNYNKPWDLFDDREIRETLATARHASLAARTKATNASPVEQALIAALALRYQSEEPAPNLYRWSDEYATAMRAVYGDFGDDPDVATLFVEALMNLTPWNMWDPRTGEPIAEAETLECRTVLERAIGQNRAAGLPPHPGLWHLYVHLMEMSPIPEVALRVGDELRRAVPDSGHLAHMPTHIDVLCGNYQDVVDWNHVGIEKDVKYWEHAGAYNFYSNYRVHNYHFKLYGAMFLGQFTPAADAVRAMHDTIPDELVHVESPPMADWLEGYKSIGTHALVRFGRWQELIDAPLPKDPGLFCMTAAMNYYGKGVAYAALKRHDEAADAQRRFEEIAATVPETRHLHVVKCQDVLAVARELLAGEIAYHRGDFDAAFSHLRQAVANEDALPYDEPWGWMMPSRHALGALLLEQGHAQEAAAAYEADLGLTDEVPRANRHPNNVWALLGLHRCYELLGEAAKARMIRPQLDVALARADPEVRSSCFCSNPLDATTAITEHGSSCCGVTT
jgi:tetratricopeptide (TPR) repeat protein